MLHRFRGRQYRFVFSDLLAHDTNGATEDPKYKRPKIVVRPELPNELEVLIHEALHACYWDLGEEAIEQGARDIAGFLTKLGYAKGEV